MKAISRSGVLVLVILALTLVACGGGDPITEDQVFTMEEIAEFDGQDGRPAYVVVDGTVYDVSSIPQWAGGMHQGIAAGQDVTEQFKNQSPHSQSTLNRATIVGTIEE